MWCAKMMMLVIAACSTWHLPCYAYTRLCLAATTIAAMAMQQQRKKRQHLCVYIHPFLTGIPCECHHRWRESSGYEKCPRATRLGTGCAQHDHPQATCQYRQTNRTAVSSCMTFTKRKYVGGNGVRSRLRCQCRQRRRQTTCLHSRQHRHQHQHLRQRRHPIHCQRDFAAGCTMP